MKREQKAFSNVITHGKYARYDEELRRRETWEEICDRNYAMHAGVIQEKMNIVPEWAWDGLHAVRAQTFDAFENYVKQRKVLMSMRAAQFAGKPALIAPNRMYNCSYMPLSEKECFREAMFLLLGGTGVGFSVQRHHINQLPEIVHPNPSRSHRYKIPDSAEGWADAIGVLMDSYTGARKSTVRFDFSDIRPKGAPLKTSGGKAPGPAPLKKALVLMENILSDIPNGHKMRPIQAYDLMCHIADAVLAGGIRRSAMICLFSLDDEEMLKSKQGNFGELHPHRYRSNNSAVVVRHRVTKEDFDNLWSIIVRNSLGPNGSGEPGIFFTNDKDWGTNPCCEISLRPYSFCNLTEVLVGDLAHEYDEETDSWIRNNLSMDEIQEEFNSRVEAAALLGTLQATFTDFHYLRDVWRNTTEKDALLGVSMTGIATLPPEVFAQLDLSQAAKIATRVNRDIASKLGINPAARVTCVKPAGTTSCVLGTSSGIHGYWGDYWIRSARLNKEEALAKYLMQEIPELVEEDVMNHNQIVVGIPQSIPHDEVVTRHENPIDFLERVKRVSIDWIRPGHHDGMNSHNVSATVLVKEDEWDMVGNWMWENRDCYNGLSLLPFDGGRYEQAPFRECEKEEYESKLPFLKDIDVTKVYEYEDNTNLTGEIACGGGSCEI